MNSAIILEYIDAEITNRHSNDFGIKVGFELFKEL